MRVNTNYNSPSFGVATFNKCEPLLLKMPAEQLRQIRQWQEDPKIKNSKNWDLEITMNSDGDNFSPTYINKDKSARIEEHDCGLDAFRVKGDTVYAHSYTYDENVHDELRFPSPERAKEAFEVMQGKDWNLTPFERVERYMKTLKFLDESYEFMKNNK